MPERPPTRTSDQNRANPSAGVTVHCRHLAHAPPCAVHDVSVDSWIVSERGPLSRLVQPIDDQKSGPVVMSVTRPRFLGTETDVYISVVRFGDLAADEAADRLAADATHELPPIRWP